MAAHTRPARPAPDQRRHATADSRLTLLGQRGGLPLLQGVPEECEGLSFLRPGILFPGKGLAGEVEEVTERGRLGEGKKPMSFSPSPPSPMVLSASLGRTLPWQSA